MQGNASRLGSGSETYDFVLMIWRQGMKRYHARVAVVQALKDAGLYIKTENNPMEIKVCRYLHRLSSFLSSGLEHFSRKSGDIIEPVLKPQWYVNCTPLAEEAIKVCLAPP